MTSLWQDLRYGLRMLGNNPGFAVIAILTLALDFGATTVIWSVVDSVLAWHAHDQRGPNQRRLAAFLRRSHQARA